MFFRNSNVESKRTKKIYNLIRMITRITNVVRRAVIVISAKYDRSYLQRRRCNRNCVWPYNWHDYKLDRGNLILRWNIFNNTLASDTLSRQNNNRIDDFSYAKYQNGSISLNRNWKKFACSELTELQWLKQCNGQCSMGNIPFFIRRMVSSSRPNITPERNRKKSLLLIR